MEKELFDFVAERADVLAASEASKQETKDAALAWKSAVEGADDEAIEAATTKFIDFLEGRPNTVDGVIAFAQGPAVELFGKETADQILATQTARKEQGEKYCDCDACTAAVELLTKFERI
ncbi:MULTISPECIES: 3-hydroxyisobutyrate dehydrogenase [Gordonibacter]|uniref:3-hydroxyisobutyrate dehydrogenase n=1 Tax=Gordonibacter faecis TaxID=3047475 RepID=A0ABT7DMP5_9ACTN|nr:MULTISPECIES: 3-hydroxyisobutyrate dehydrogenase [unclassified Gordonibacter]MDJ1650802.1 3-hydroxyisobutyrate dehydrogenase [Gordonibacter sp. KGMB12511]HIW77168.1 3-hydroxyisobutyrate dehydrogenase [Candidatus Gordonibacter avicola]